MPHREFDLDSSAHLQPPQPAAPLKLTVEAAMTAASSQPALLQAIYDISPDGVLVVDEEGQVLSHNLPFLQICNLNPGTAHGSLVPSTMSATQAQDLLPKLLDQVQDPEAYLARLRQLQEHPDQVDRCEIALKDGRTLERQSTVLRDGQQRSLGRAWFFRDVTAQKRHEAELVRLARYDPLTGAANRRYFLERAEQECARSRRHQLPLSVMLVDLDHFKQINDQYGHAYGDEALKQFSAVVRGRLRDSDLLARIGGEEFIVLMPSTALAGATLLAERLRTALANQPLPIIDHLLPVRFSAGVTQFKGDDQDIETCLKRADEAMYRAKQSGRDRVEAYV
ncbi:diguanylate cyclase [Hylemonella gracilis str. Niagara R]|uniref:Diguanylate cyclase n=1 Tax=Hylemonella gracilis str. Niagara R TaxID=1458275 RepID=A0A016XJI8_9BURK|nr:diguanylate cyclase [Hylemonella gracilis str. Niagara R]